MLLKDAKIGQKVRISLYDLKCHRNGHHGASKAITATIISEPSISPITSVAWLPEETPEKGLSLFHVFTYSNPPPGLATLTKGIDLMSDTPCELIQAFIPLKKNKNIKSNPALFLFACIGAGASISHYNKLSVQKHNKITKDKNNVA